MSASPSDRRGASACLAHALIAAWIVVGPTVASGQRPGQALGPPISLLPPPPPEVSAPVSTHDQDVASEPLAPPAPGWSAGAPPPREALPDALWQGTARAMVEGEPQPPTAWTSLPETAWAAASSPCPSPAAAARAKRVGETILAAVMVAFPAGTLSTDPLGLFMAVSSLRQVGLDADTRRLAVEAALAAGL